MYRSKVCVQEFGHIVPGLDIQPGTAKCGSAATSHKPVFGERSIRTHGSEVKALPSESGDLEWILAGC